MEPSALPHWAQTIFYVVIAIGTAGVGLFKYFKTSEKEPIAGSTGANASTSSVISASFIDSKLMRELIEAIREDQDERSRDNKKSHRLSQDLKDSVDELNETMIVHNDTTLNLVRFITRETGRSRVKTLEEE